MTTVDQEITRTFVQSIHKRQVSNGVYYDNNQQEIIDVLGGIDNILVTLFQSNAIMNQTQLNELHQILTKPPKPQKTITVHKQSHCYENNKSMQLNHEPIVHYKFSEKDTFLYNWFAPQTATRILRILNSRIIKSILILMLFIDALTFILRYFVLPTHIMLYVWSIVGFAFSLYLIMWMLYINKEALKLLLQEFEMWFKLFYLVQYMIATILIKHFEGYPAHYNISASITLSVFLFVVMVFDAVKARQTTKRLTSAFAVGIFSWSALRRSRQSYYSDQYMFSEQTTFQIDDPLGFGDVNISLINIAANASQILVIFLFKQFIVSVMRPKQAMVITIRVTKPFIEYESYHNAKPNHSTHPTAKNIRNWKRICVLYWVFTLLLFGFYYVLVVYVSETSIVNNLCWIAMLSLLCLGFCLLLDGKIKSLWIANIICFFIIIMYAINALVLHWHSAFLQFLLLLLAVLSSYSLKVIEYEKFETLNLIETINAKKKVGNDNDNEETVISMGSTAVPDIRMVDIKPKTHGKRQSISLSSLKETTSNGMGKVLIQSYSTQKERDGVPETAGEATKDEAKKEDDISEEDGGGVDDLVAFADAYFETMD